MCPAGGNGPSTDSNNSDLATSVTPKVGTAVNPIQANIRPKTGGKDIRKKESDNGDISSVRPESSPVITPTVNNNLSTTAPDVRNTNPEEKDDDDCSWTTGIAEARAPLGKFREYLIPDKPDNNSEINRKKWLKDIKYCLQNRFVYCH